MTDPMYSPEVRIVAFLDILGFKEQTKRCLDDSALLKRLDQALMNTRILSEPYLEYAADVRMFSDCVCASSPFQPDNVFKFIYAVEALQMNLACAGVFIRGGIAIGRHFQSPRMILSEGLIEAYLLESQVALFPRIAIADSTVALMTDALHAAGPDQWAGDAMGLKESPNNHFRRDSDGTLFLSYLMSLHRIDSTSIVDMYMTTHKRAVESWIAEGRQGGASARIREKHEWVRQYHNTIIAEFFGHSPDDTDAAEMIP